VERVVFRWTCWRRGIRADDTDDIVTVDHCRKYLSCEVTVSDYDDP
jgi:hypothetical protein